MKRLEKNYGLDESFLLNAKKPYKRKFIYPIEFSDEDSEENCNKNKSPDKDFKKKKKGWLK